MIHRIVEVDRELFHFVFDKIGWLVVVYLQDECLGFLQRLLDLFIVLFFLLLNLPILLIILLGDSLGVRANQSCLLHQIPLTPRLAVLLLILRLI